MTGNIAGAEGDLLTRLTSLKETISRHWKLELTTALIVFASAAIVITLMPDVYRAETRILVNPQTVSHEYVNSAVSLNPTERLNTLSQQVLSSTRLQVIFDELQLFPKLRNKVSQQLLLERMRSRIGIEVRQSTDGPSSFKLSYTGDTAQEVAAVTDRLAQSFISWNLQDREREAQSTTKFLASELVTNKQQLDVLEEQLRLYKLRHLGELPGQLDANLQTLSRLQTQLQGNSDAQNRLENEVLLARMSEPAGRHAESSRAMDAQHPEIMASIQAHEELAALQKRYTATYPDVIAKEGEVALLDKQASADSLSPITISSGEHTREASKGNPQQQMIARSSRHLGAEQHAIESSIRDYQGRVNAAPIREQEIAQLLRDYDTAKEHYRSLLEKTYAAQMASALESKQQGGSFTILDPARVPDLPIAPDRRTMLLGALALALVMAAAAAMLYEKLDSTVKSEENLRLMLPGIPLLGLVPCLLPAGSSGLGRHKPDRSGL